MSKDGSSWSNAIDEVRGHGRFSGGTIETIVGGEFRPSPASSAGRTAVTGLADGGFVVAWWAFAPVTAVDVYWQRYDANGVAVGTRRTLDTYAEDPDLAPTADGGFVAAWMDLGPTPPLQDLNIRLQRFDSAGAPVGSSMLVNNLTAGQQWTPAVAVLADGSVVVTWWDEYRKAVYVRQFDRDGLPLSDQVQVDPLLGGGRVPDVTALADGGYVVVWAAYDGTSPKIFQQRFDAGGTPIGSQARISPTATGAQNEPSVVALDDGGYFVAWVGTTPDGWNSAIYGQRFRADGLPAADEVVVSQTTAGVFEPAAAALSDRGFVITWPAGSELVARGFDAQAMPTGDQFRVNEASVGYEWYPAIAALPGGYVVVWNGNSTVVGRIFHDVLQGTQSDNWLEGSAADDTILALGGADRLYGLAGDDRLDGGAGDDFMVGGGGDDRYVVDSEKDKVLEHPSEGNDTVLSSVSYRLDSHVEQLVLLGSRAVDATGNRLDNSLTGNAANNRLEGLGGNDTIFGADGDDTIVGGDGDDVISGQGGRDQIVLHGGANAGRDLVHFDATEDVIVLQGRLGRGMKAGPLEPDAFAIGAAALDATARVIFDPTTGTLFMDLDGAGGDEPTAIATLVILVGQLSAENFVVA